MANGPGEQGHEELDLASSPRMPGKLAGILFKPWPWLDELVDNSFYGFLWNADRDPSHPSRVDAALPHPQTDDENAHVCVADNGKGCPNPSGRRPDPDVFAC